MAMPLLARAAQSTIRAIQEEADFIRRAACPISGPARRHRARSRRRRRRFRAEADRRRAEEAPQIQIGDVVPAARAREANADHGGDRLDSIVQVKSNGEIVLYSTSSRRGAGRRNRAATSPASASPTWPARALRR
jgi:hypothetical protein